MNTAIVTILMGDESRRMWNTTFAATVHRYADRHGYDVVALDESHFGQVDRHPSWLKLKVFDHVDHDRVVWLDHDVMIADHAPCIVGSMDDPDKFGAVTWQGSYRQDPIQFAAFQETWRGNGSHFVREAGHRKFSDLLTHAGYPPCEDWMNCGVMVMSRHHQPILDAAWNDRRDDIKTSKEALAMIHHLLDRNSDQVEPLDRRFNAIWDTDVCIYYPWLHHDPRADIAYQCVTAYANAHYFIHFINSHTRTHAMLLRLNEAQRELECV